jgi:Ca2+-binding RTX toxin-like protein
LQISGVGTTSTFLDDQRGPAGRTYQLGTSGLQFSPALPSIVFVSAPGGVILNQAEDAETFVTGTAAGQLVTLNLGPETNVVTDGSTSQKMQSLTVNGQAGNDRLVLQDQGATLSPPIYWLAAGSVRRLGVTVSYSGMTTVQLDGGHSYLPSAFPTDYSITSIAPDTQVLLTPSGSNNVLSGPDTSNTWEITGSNSGRLDSSIEFTGIGTLAGGSADNTFIVATGASLSGSLDGGGGTNTLIGPNTTNTWSLAGTNSGQLDRAIDFTSIQNLTGGTGVDVFLFGPRAGVMGRIDGGGGGDWLDYSTYNFPGPFSRTPNTPVTVNLATGEAIGVGGGIARIQNVRGGTLGNTLTGDAQGNILIGGSGADTITGGSGRSILIGGSGADQIAAGSGDSILIGGDTVYDSSSLAHDLALESILAEWQSADSYATRVADITNGGGENGANRLAWGITVSDDDAANVLIGGIGMDWFFKGAKDELKYLRPGEQIN